MRISDWSSDVCSSDLFSGASGLAIGFGLQKTVGNLIAGIILLMDRSIKPGDVLVVGDAASMGVATLGGVPNVGRVAKIGVRAEIGRASCRARVCQYV